MDVKLIKCEVSLDNYRRSGHTLKEDAMICDADETFKFQQVLSPAELLVKEVETNKFEIIHITSETKVLLNCVLEEDIDFKHIIQRELKFEDK